MGNKTKKLLSLNDLYDFYSTKKKSMNFSADKEGYNISVQVNGQFSVKESDNSEGLLYTTLHVFHDLGNRNKSFIDTEVLEKHLQSMKDRPIMADIVEVEDDDGNLVKDFSGHTMEFVEENGVEKIKYIEKPVGHFINPEDFHLEWSDKYERNFVVADGVIYEEYTDACDILRRRQSTACSVELCIRDLAYDCKTKELHINDFYVQGCTLLGESVPEGMLGSHCKLKDFSESNNSVFYNLEEEANQKLIETLEKLNATLSNLNINKAEFSADKNSKEGGKKVTKFEELLQKYNKTESDIEFEIEGLSDEELEIKFAEMFGEESNEDPASEEGEVTENTTVTEAEFEESEVVAEAETEVPEVIKTESEETENANEETTEVVEVNEVEETAEPETTEEVKFELIEKSFEVDGRKYSVSFTLSHEDIKYGLYNLLDAYCELDNDWYDVRAVYDDSFVFQGWFTGKIYGQKYTKDGDTVALDGERYELFEELLTVTEKAELESMRANYSSIQTELNTYKLAEEKADKMTVFDDENYAQFLETPEFKELIKTVDKYSKEELEDKANIAFSKLVKKNKTFSLEIPTEEKPKATMFAFGRVTEAKSSFLDGLLKK